MHSVFAPKSGAGTAAAIRRPHFCISERIEYNEVMYMDPKYAALIPIVYAIVEAAEKFGLKRNIAHLCTLPLGVLISFLVIQNKSIYENILYGILIGFGAIGTCDTVCNSMELVKSKKQPKNQKEPQNKN
jgi:hypothetical protein